MGKVVKFTDKQREDILRIIGECYAPHCCDNCAHYMGCSGAHNLGGPCNECHNGTTNRYEPDYYAKESDEMLFSKLEEVINGKD